MSGTKSWVKKTIGGALAVTMLALGGIGCATSGKHEPGTGSTGLAPSATPDRIYSAPFPNDL